MVMKKLILLLTTVAMTVAMAATASYSLKITAPTWVGNTELKAGSYRLQIDGDKAVILQGKKMVAEVGATMEEAPNKYPITSMVVDRADASRPKLQELHIGGKRTRILIKN